MPQDSLFLSLSLSLFLSLPFLQLRVSSSESCRLVIHSTDYSKLLEGLPVDGIALTPDGERIFYSALGGTELHLGRLLDFFAL